MLLAGCTSFADREPAPVEAAPTTTADPGVCPAERAEPDPGRPRVDYDFRLSDDLRTVTGSETVRFAPDVPTPPRGAGAATFDAAVRCYVDATTWTIANPEDVAAALSDPPAAVEVLIRADALDEDDIPR